MIKYVDVHIVYDVNSITREEWLEKRKSRIG